MDDEKLIDLVRGEEILYNKFCSGYRIPDNKLRAWTNIAQQLGATEEECKKRWTTLRERFSRECKQMDSPSGSGASCHKHWPLFGALSFLKEHVKPRPTRCRVNISTNSSSSSPSPLPSPTPKPLTDFFLYEDEVTMPSTPRAKKRRAVVGNDIDEEFREACQSYKTLCENQEPTGNKTLYENQEPKGNNVVHAFGQFMVATVSGISVRKQTNAMRKLTDLAMALKLEDEDED